MNWSWFCIRLLKLNIKAIIFYPFKFENCKKTSKMCSLTLAIRFLDSLERSHFLLVRPPHFTLCWFLPSKRANSMNLIASLFQDTFGIFLAKKNWLNYISPFELISENKLFKVQLNQELLKATWNSAGTYV